MSSVIAVVFGLLGALIGSFLNVVIYRVPANKSIVSPPSACGSCGARIRPWDNIPIVSWLVLRGRCRDCGAHISARYPAVELGTALFFAGVAWWVAATATLPLTTPDLLALILMAVALLYLASISVALALIDLDTHTLPNAIVLPAYLVGGVLLAASALLAGEPGRLLSAGIGGGGLFGLYLVLALVRPGGMGLGDVKLAGVLGLFLGWLGWGALFVGAFGAFLLGGVFGTILMLFGKAGRKSSIPFGPWMLMGAWVGIFAGDQLATSYLGLFGLA
ncbi:A24 family peptidase [Cryobacterium sp. PH31-O1]|uniref:prepilin peptidase n=1 Tax=Cryobacterium sp. PH31-O1 TaxID=3046306 RepID=UPI0024BB396C|nr:A24 family peptidase [Cryobacterium sp. PH31-O1]MDJ0337782.1 prepilin peptidase [Cryobacterium sp. PH31-O1]